MIADLSPSDRSKYACALHASKLVKSGMKVGLGTGSTAYWLVYHLAERVRNEDLKFFGVPTSNKTRDQAQAEGIKVISMDDAGRLDLTIDGADEFDQSMNLIKGKLNNQNSEIFFENNSNVKIPLNNYKFKNKTNEQLSNSIHTIHKE